mmetsp:Transcript_107894/g.315434  ORF Transcript_107894/g.315434 Transcript_107894/m.315434 type:complete len:208 (+) Transcript_107894:330-953(+)
MDVEQLLSQPMHLCSKARRHLARIQELHLRAAPQGGRQPKLRRQGQHVCSKGLRISSPSGPRLLEGQLARAVQVLQDLRSQLARLRSVLAATTLAVGSLMDVFAHEAAEGAQLLREYGQCISRCHALPERGLCPVQRSRQVVPRRQRQREEEARTAPVPCVCEVRPAREQGVATATAGGVVFVLQGFPQKRQRDPVGWELEAGNVKD